MASRSSNPPLLPRAFRAWPLAWPSPSGPLGWQRSPGSTARRRRVPRSGMRSTVEAGGARSISECYGHDARGDGKSGQRGADDDRASATRRASVASLSAGDVQEYPRVIEERDSHAVSWSSVSSRNRRRTSLVLRFSKLALSLLFNLSCSDRRVLPLLSGCSR